jgi:hypothetical protein
MTAQKDAAHWLSGGGLLRALSGLGALVNVQLVNVQLVNVQLVNVQLASALERWHAPKAADGRWFMSQVVAQCACRWLQNERCSRRVPSKL